MLISSWCFWHLEISYHRHRFVVVVSVARIALNNLSGTSHGGVTMMIYYIFVSLRPDSFWKILCCGIRIGLKVGLCCFSLIRIIFYCILKWLFTGEDLFAWLVSEGLFYNDGAILLLFLLDLFLDFYPVAILLFFDNIESAVVILDHSSLFNSFFAFTVNYFFNSFLVSTDID